MSIAIMINYRRITLSSTMSKICEMCVMLLFGNYHNFLFMHDLQVGFKKKLGCNHVLHMLRSIVEHHNANETAVTICTLDISKLG